MRRTVFCLALLLLLAACGGETGEMDRTATLSISCASILDHMDELAEGKRDLVPEDGIILPETEVSFAPGESVYDILVRVVRERDIHMEASTTPVTGAVYVEGIHNLYAFDCGPLSGWQYTVNGEVVGDTASACLPEDGDVIAWVYTCDLGRDIQT